MINYKFKDVLDKLQSEAYKKSHSVDSLDELPEHELIPKIILAYMRCLHEQITLSKNSLGDGEKLSSEKQEIDSLHRLAGRNKSYFLMDAGKLQNHTLEYLSVILYEKNKDFANQIKASIQEYYGGHKY